jgi:aminoglycoside phosphotransferase (APT) family kinase protein
MRGLVEDGAGRLPGAFVDVAAWLEAHVPVESGASLVHNDYRLGNVILGPTGAVAAVLDWELATIGDPLFAAYSPRLRLMISRWISLVPP